MNNLSSISVTNTALYTKEELENNIKDDVAAPEAGYYKENKAKLEKIENAVKKLSEKPELIKHTVIKFHNKEIESKDSALKALLTTLDFVNEIITASGGIEQIAQVGPERDLVVKSAKLLKQFKVSNNLSEESLKELNINADSFKFIKEQISSIIGLLKFEAGLTSYLEKLLITFGFRPTPKSLDLFQSRSLAETHQV